jgi:hypothetical protein
MTDYKRLDTHAAPRADNRAGGPTLYTAGK